VTQLTLFGVAARAAAVLCRAGGAWPGARILTVFLISIAVCALRYPVCRLADRSPRLAHGAPAEVPAA
jgi:hypothetical protein